MYLQHFPASKKKQIDRKHAGQRTDHLIRLEENVDRIIRQAKNESLHSLVVPLSDAMKLIGGRICDIPPAPGDQPLLLSGLDDL